ncbi:MAG TPA: DUF1553 domain-containing protein [Gemmataceae bacterium]|nr:DUF1553 domain-containing protein [Gemmataceae bacterium]
MLAARFVCLFVLLGCTSLAAAEPAPSFERDVAPLLTARCLKCHSGTTAKGDLDLTRRDRLLTGGTSGAVVAPGKSADSLLFDYVRDKKMPPKQPLSNKEIDLLRRWIDAGVVWQGPALTPPRVETQRAGLDWWSLQPIRRPTPPAVSHPAWIRTPIDAFILARLDKLGLPPAPETDRRTYIRRVTLDLTGLLPTPEEIDAFVADTSANVYEKLVDRLLASPTYGERWARHWLDVVRFAESHGYEMNTLRPNAWPYRDYVIRAFNEDISYPQFVREQLAGDALGKGDALQMAATGFLVGGPHDMVGNATLEGKLLQRSDDLFDMVSTTGATFLGLTIGCARCHDHKFDPITQKDFYSLQAVFAGVEHAEREMAGPSSEERRHTMETVRAERDRLDREIDALEPPAAAPGSAPSRPPVQPRRNVERFTPIEVRFVRFTVTATIDRSEPCIDELELYGPGAGDGNLALSRHGARATASSVYPNNPLHRIEHVNDGRLGNGRSWISREPGKGWVQIELPAATTIERIVWGRDREQKYRDRLPREYRIEVSTDGQSWKPVAGSWDRQPPGQAVAIPQAVRKLLDQRRRLDERLLTLTKPVRIYAGAFHTPEPTHVLKRGDPMQKLEEVPPAALSRIGPRFVLKPGATEAERRLALADWIAHPDNPLPARVMVNRIWQGHFGQGLVRTPSDFGFNGDRPSHPQLLDWLAKEYQANGWRLKPLHRRIVLSNTYRQASRLDARASAVDASNRLLWRYPSHRLEAEAIRDTMLQVSGALNRRMGGPGYHLWEYSGYVINFKPKTVYGPDEFRRMIYQFKPRLQQDRTFGVFDCPDATTTMPRRNRSTTALQALNLLNDPFVLDQSARFADRLRQEVGAEPNAQIRHAFRLAFGREPSMVEANAANKLVQKHGLAVLCRALFNANEFVFVN